MASKKNRKKEIKRLFEKPIVLGPVIAAIITSVAGLLIALFEYVIDSRPPSYQNKTAVKLMSIEEIEAIITDENKLTVYKDTGDTNTYYDGAAFMLLYHNLDEEDRVIKKFTVQAYDIVEDLSINGHYLNFDFMLSTDGAMLYFQNNEWSETGIIEITLTGIEKCGQHLPDISLKDDVSKSWALDSVAPGESDKFMLLHSSDFFVECEESFEGIGQYFLNFTMDILEYDYHYDFVCEVMLSDTGLSFDTGGQGAGDINCYAIGIGTSEPTWSESFDTYQVIPGKQSVCIPILVVPEKPCELSLQIEFETLDGKKFRSPLLENKKIYVPYYDEMSNYINANLIDWDTIDDEYCVKSYPYEDNLQTFSSVVE